MKRGSLAAQAALRPLWEAAAIRQVTDAVRNQRPASRLLDACATIYTLFGGSLWIAPAITGSRCPARSVLGLKLQAYVLHLY